MPRPTTAPASRRFPVAFAMVPLLAAASVCTAAPTYTAGVTSQAVVGELFVTYSRDLTPEQNDPRFQPYLDGGKIHLGYQSTGGAYAQPASASAVANPNAYDSTIMAPWDGTTYPVHASANGTGTASS